MIVQELINKLEAPKQNGFDVIIASHKRRDDICVWVNEITRLVTLEAVDGNVESAHKTDEQLAKGDD